MVKTVKKLQVPFERAFLEHQFSAPYENISRWEAGRGVTEHACNFKVCPDNIIICTPGAPGSEVNLYQFNAQDDGGDTLTWTGNAANQSGGANGTSHYYFHGNSPSAWSHVMAIDPEIPVTITGYVRSMNLPAEQFRIGFFSAGLGSSGSSSFLISYITLWDAAVDGEVTTEWTPFSRSTTTPIGTIGFALGKNSGGISFDEIRVNYQTIDEAPSCSIYSQDGDVVLISGSNTPTSWITSSLTASGSYTTFALPSQAAEVSNVWLDQLPTDTWDYVPQDNTIVLPVAVIADTKVMVRYINAPE